MLRTYQPKKLYRRKEHGFRRRMSDRNGCKVSARRRVKRRTHLSYRSFERVTAVWPFFVSLFRKAGYGEVEVSQRVK